MSDDDGKDGKTWGLDDDASETDRDAEVDERIRKAREDFKAEFRAKTARAFASAGAALLGYPGVRHLLKHALRRMSGAVPAEVLLFTLACSEDEHVAASAWGLLHYLRAQREVKIAKKKE
jgi:hypothetical protein